MELDLIAPDALDGQQHAALIALLTSAFPADPPELLEVELARASDPRLGLGLCAVEGEQVLGAILARLPSARSAFVIYLATAEPDRRQGIARALLDRLSVSAGTQFALFVTDDNVAAERLYRAGGLAPDGGPAPAQQRRWSGTWQPRTVATSDTAGVS